MPFYEYQCKSCGHDLEAMQKISEAPLKKCPHCGKSQLQRLMSAPVFRLKGGGWYETDFKGDKDSQRNLADRPEASEEKSKDAGKDGADTSEAKTEAPKDAASKEAAPKDKAADKPADKATSAEKKPDTSKSAAPAAPTARSSSASKRTVKKPAAKARRRR